MIMQLYHGSNVVVAKPEIQITGYYKDLVAGNISREAFWALVKFKRPTHQIVFCTDKALQTLKYERSYSL
jgi:hypothetical protein